MSHKDRSLISTGLGDKGGKKREPYVLSNDGPLSNRNQMKLRGERMPDLKDAPSSRKGIKHLI